MKQFKHLSHEEKYATKYKLATHFDLIGDLPSDLRTG